ncbi:MAG: hypothetical protein VYA30_03800 [Myxococcota bacterium]|nr:hypothetical protein [Myxococcota bacterium]
MSRHINKPFKLIIVVILWPTLSLALPEGTIHLGPQQGVDRKTIIRVHIEAAGEQIEFCTSDDGYQEPQFGDLSIDLNPGEPHQTVSDTRRRREIIVYEPEPTPCSFQRDCSMMGKQCVDRATGEEFNPALENGAQGVCASVFAVSGPNATADIGLGYCDWTTENITPHRLVADSDGIWEFDFVGEPETLIPDPNGIQANTRYFQFNVLDGNGEAVDGGRVHSPSWLLNLHAQSATASGTFYIPRPNGEDYTLWMLDYSAWSGGLYLLQANSMGVENHKDQSWCLYFDPNEERCVERLDAARAELVSTEFDLYLNPPTHLDFETPDPTIAELTFNDQVGTNSISPNGDGVQDDLVMSLSSTTSGIIRLFLDLNQDGAFDPADELVLRRDLEPGETRFRWNGHRLSENDPLPDGTYRFLVTVGAAELHTPLTGIEQNLEGIGFRQYRPDVDPVPAAAYWNDTSVRTDDHLIDGNDRLQNLPGDELAEAEASIRRWRQPEFPERNIPIVFDTWTQSAWLTLSEASCDRCPNPIGEIRIGGEDEPPDSDRDGLTDDEEDINGNGQLDPGETSPNDPDTDDDGLTDAQERAGGTDPRAADSDSDGLADGQEDTNGNGIQDDGETDPNNPDTDGDGILDGQDAFPLNPSRPDADPPGSSDAGTTDTMTGPSGRYQGDMGTAGKTRLLEFDTLGCDCSTSSDWQKSHSVLLTMLFSFHFLRRRRNQRR